VANTVELTLLARDQASQVIRGVMGQLQGMMGQLTMLAGLGGAGMGLGALIKQGIDFNKTMEDSKGGIAGVLLMTRQYVDATGKVVAGQGAMNAAFAEASTIQEKLKKDALGTAASYTELVGAFQTALAPAAAAGVTNLDDVREITVMATQAMAALNIPTAQAAQELRGLFAGDTNPDNRLNQILRVLPEDLAKVRGNAEAAAKMFKERLGPAASAAAMQTGTLTVRLSNLGDILDQTMGEATAGLFKDISELIAEVSAGVGDSAGVFGDLGDTVREAMAVVKETVEDVFGTATKSVTDAGFTWRDVFFGLSVLFVGFVESVGSGMKYITQFLTAPIETIRGLWKSLVGGLAALLGEFLSTLADTPVIGKLFKGASESVDRFVVSLTTGDAAFDRFQKKAEANWGDGAFSHARKMMEEYGKEAEKTTATLGGLGSQAKKTGAEIGAGVIDLKKFLAATKEQGRSYASIVQTDLEKTLAYFRTGEAAVEEFIGVLERKRGAWQRAIDDIFRFTPDDASAGVKAGMYGVFAALPSAAESAANAVQGVWQGMARAFDDSFYSVLTGRLDSLKDVFKNLWESILQTFSRYMSDLLQRWIATQMKMGQSGQLKALPGATTYGADGTTTTYTSGGLPQGGYTGAATGAGIGLGVGSLVGQLGNGKYNQTGGMIGGALGGAIGGGSATLGAALGGWAGPIGAIVGALIGTLIGALVSPNTMQHVRGSLGAMMSKKEWIPDEWVRPLLSGGGPRVEGQPWSPPVYGDPEFIKGHWDYGQQARTELEVTGKAILDTQSATFADLFRLGAEEQSRDLLATYRASLKASLTGATFDINAGSSATIQQATEYFTTKLLPRIGLSAAFGQVGYLPTGNQDLPGGVGNISYRTPGMNADGTWTEKKLFSEDSPLFKMMVGIKDASGAYADGLGFTVEKFAELAARISTDDPEKLLAYITGIVGVVVGLRDLGAEMGKTFGELTKGWADEAAAGPTAALAEQAQSIAELFDNLDLYSGDEQLKKAQEAQAASDQLWQSVVSYLQQLDALAEKLSAGLQGMREKMRDFLSPLSEAGAVAATQATIDETWGKLLTATNSGQIEAATNEAAAAIEALFNVMAERVTRGKALIERLTKLDRGLWDIGKDLASEQLEKTNPLASIGQDMVDIQRGVADAARLTGLEQIAAMEDVAGSAEEMSGKLRSLFSEIASVSESISKSIDSQIWELGVGEMDPTGQATAITQRIKELQDQLQLATSPAEIQAITSEIQSLTGRYVGQFTGNDPEQKAKRAEAIAWAQQELERTRGLANETLELMRAQAEEYAKGLQDLIKGSVTTISTNVDEASAAIGQLSQTLSELDRVVREQLERLGTAALDALEPLRTAMEGAAGIFTGATGAAAESLTAPETGLTASTDRAAARLDVFTGALDRAVTNLDRLANAGGGAKEAPASKQVAASGSQSRVTAAEVVPLVRRYFGQLTPRVS